jgi:hypothetical protein
MDERGVLDRLKDALQAILDRHHVAVMDDYLVGDVGVVLCHLQVIHIDRGVVHLPDGPSVPGQLSWFVKPRILRSLAAR